MGCRLVAADLKVDVEIAGYDEWDVVAGHGIDEAQNRRNVLRVGWVGHIEGIRL